VRAGTVVSHFHPFFHKVVMLSGSGRPCGRPEKSKHLYYPKFVSWNRDPSLARYDKGGRRPALSFHGSVFAEILAPSLFFVSQSQGLLDRILPSFSRSCCVVSGAVSRLFNIPRSPMLGPKALRVSISA
jgi:hypothetical protein